MPSRSQRCDHRLHQRTADALARDAPGRRRGSPGTSAAPSGGAAPSPTGRRAAAAHVIAAPIAATIGSAIRASSPGVSTSSRRARPTSLRRPDRRWSTPCRRRVRRRMSWPKARPEVTSRRRGSGATHCPHRVVVEGGAEQVARAAATPRRWPAGPVDRRVRSRRTGRHSPALAPSEAMRCASRRGSDRCPRWSVRTRRRWPGRAHTI